MRCHISSKPPPNYQQFIEEVLGLGPKHFILRPFHTAQNLPELFGPASHSQPYWTAPDHRLKPCLEPGWRCSNRALEAEWKIFSSLTEQAWLPKSSQPPGLRRCDGHGGIKSKRSEMIYLPATKKDIYTQAHYCITWFSDLWQSFFVRSVHHPVPGKVKTFPAGASDKVCRSSG